MSQGWVVSMNFIEIWYPQSWTFNVECWREVVFLTECWSGGWATRDRTWAATSRWTTCSPGSSTGQTCRRSVNPQYVYDVGNGDTDEQLNNLLSSRQPPQQIWPVCLRRTLFLSWLRRCPTSGPQVIICQNSFILWNDSFILTRVQVQEGHILDFNTF